MTIKGFYTKLKDITNAQIEHVTVSEVTGDKIALDVNVVSGGVGGGGGGTSDTTAANQATQIARLDSLIVGLTALTAQEDIPAHTHQRFTFVTSGNGLGEVETVRYYSGTTASEVLEQTRTFTYDSNNNVVLMEKS